MYRIRFYQEARDYLEKISDDEKRFILNKINELRKNPYSHSKLIPLKGYKKLWKFYMKENRAIIKIIMVKNQIIVLTIGHRGDVYRKFFGKRG
jgi:mRNA-degrading endonuclease RelE of RelBE toxin-antitoxin system|tara:strand:- start:216 stop:494 length:279 start_codon:yes stop_codon:yes gene_type:complete